MAYPLHLVRDEDVAAATLPAVVAEILSDGTIRARSPHVSARVTESAADWSTGQLADDGWMLWWERRRNA